METKFEKVRAIEDDIEAIKKVKHFSPREGERSWRDLMAEQGALHLAKTLVGTRDNRGERKKGWWWAPLHFILALTNCYLNCISEL